MKYLIALLIAFSTLTFAQELNCKVVVNYDNLPAKNKDLLQDFGSAVENYMNSNRFSGDDWQWAKVNCTLNIFFTSASSDIKYSAQIVVTSQRQIYKTDNYSLMLSINDNNWNFNYEKGQPLYQSLNSFDPLTSLLDYYALVIIGFDMDSWQELGGTPYFSKAFEIVNMGASSRFSTGWQKSSSSYSRPGLVGDLLNEKYRPFREAFYQYYYGVDYFKQDKAEAQKKIADLVNTLYQMKEKMDLNSVLIKTFFDAKNGEIVEYLKDYPDKSIFEKLIKIDPAHTSKYRAVLD